MTQRKSLTKKIRFEVFKRDSFTCQYCGAKSPDAVMEVDHIDPVAKGGKNEIMNLITSCFPCNRGKSDRKLSDSSILDKQRQQIEELNLRRQQLEMLLEWRTGLVKIEDDSTQKVAKYIENKTGYFLNDIGIKILSKSVKKFGIKEALDAFDIAFDKYFDGSTDSFNVAFKKIGGIANMTRQPEYIQKIAYAKGILRNRIYFNDSIGHDLMVRYHDAGYCMEDLIRYCKKVGNWTEFVEWISDLEESLEVKLW